MIKLGCFADVVLAQDAGRVCFWGDCFVDGWATFRQPIIGRYGVLFGITILESTSPLVMKGQISHA